MLRVGPEAYSKTLRAPHASDMDFTGKPLKGMVYVAAEGIARPASLKKWLRMRGTLPAKPDKPAK